MIFVPSEAQDLISNMQANLRTSRMIVNDLRRHSNTLMRALRSGKLEGRGYKAGSGMFSQLVFPTLDNSDESLTAYDKDVNRFVGAVGQAGNEVLDEDKLDEELRLLRQDEQNIYRHMFHLGNLSMGHQNDPAMMANLNRASSEAQNMLNHTCARIEEVEKKRKRLRDFNSTVNGLFKASVEMFDIVMGGVFALGLAGFDKSGNLVLQVNNNKDFQKLKDLARSGGLPKDIAKDILDPNTVSKVIQEVGSHYKVKGIRLGSYSKSSTSLSRIARKASAMEAVGDDFIDIGKSLGNLKTVKIGGPILNIIFAGLDYDEQMAKYNDWQRALKNTVAHVVIGAGGSATGAYIGGVLGTLIPIPGVGTVLGAAIGAMIGSLGNHVYDWIETGEATKYFAKFGNDLNSLKNEAGEIFAGFGKSLGGAFG